MREDLAREFPEAMRGIQWIRARTVGWRVPLLREPVLWAAVSGIGAGFLVSDVAQALVGLVGYAVQTLHGPADLTLFPLVPLTAGAATAAVALGAGGPIALALDVAYVTLTVGLRIPGVMAFCERSGGELLLAGPNQCTPLGFLISLWPQVIGIGLGIGFARAVTTRADGVNSLLRIAGGLAIALTVVTQIWSATVAQSASATTSGLTIAAGTAAAGVAGGVIAAQLPGGVRNAALVAGIWLLSWVTLQLPLGLQSLGSTVPAEYVGAIVIGIAVQPIAAAFLVLSAAVAARSRFIPRASA